MGARVSGAGMSAGRGYQQGEDEDGDVSRARIRAAVLARSSARRRLARHLSGTMDPGVRCGCAWHHLPWFKKSAYISNPKRSFGRLSNARRN
eukprot:362897-Chlamydomonas_euryale.AAC.2